MNRALIVALLGLASAVGCTSPRTPAPADAQTVRPGGTPAGAPPAYRNLSLPVEARARDLVGRMTLEEKVSQTRYDAPAIARLEIPAYNWWSEALHGVARAGKATVFPQAIGLAATFDDSLVLAVARATADEARAKHAAFVSRGLRDINQGLTFFTPNINIFRDPRWGRGQETFGEDPFLTARMGVAFVRGLQGDDPRWLETLATAKHYAVHNGPEPERHEMNMEPSEQDLWATYLPAFQATVQEAGVASVMCAYSAFRGLPDCANDALLGDILRDRWGFRGYVVSDCWALNDFYKTHGFTRTQVEAAALALRAGTDLNCGDSYPKLVDAVRSGLVDEGAVDRAVVRLMEARLRLGLFQEPGALPWDTIPYDVVAGPRHGALALEAARKSLVLLKNDGVLPFEGDPGTVAVLGPDARAYDVLVSEYNGTPRSPSYPVDAIRARAEAAGGRVLFAEGSELARGVPRLTTIPSSALTPASGPGGGLRGEYFAGAAFDSGPHLTRLDSVVDFTWLDDTPVSGLLADTFSVRWAGFLTPPESGDYRIGLTAMTGARMWFQDTLRLEFQDRFVPPTRSFDAHLEAGMSYRLRIEYRNSGPNPEAHLEWTRLDRDRRAEALAAVRAADRVVLVLGLSPNLEGEENDVGVPGFQGGDRTTLSLPAPQEELLRDVVTLGKPTVLVLASGSALAVPWAAENVDAILQAWYPGEAGGRAIADVLFGDAVPAGRLPVTLYRSVEDLPDFADYSMDGRTYRYFRGEPLYPFGYGLSYTTFGYSGLRVPDTLSGNPSDTLWVDVTNSGNRAADEVVQLYVEHPDAPFRVPVRELRGFRRVHLAPGDTRTVGFALDRSVLGVVDPQGRSVVLQGDVILSVGGQQPGQEGRLRASTTQVLSARARVTR